MTSVIDCLAELAKGGKISAATADEAKAVYLGLLARGHAEDAAALKTAESIRAKARARRSAVGFCIANPDKIPAVADAMREQWLEAKTGRKPH
jgi:hypothetical protein